MIHQKEGERKGHFSPAVSAVNQLRPLYWYEL